MGSRWLPVATVGLLLGGCVPQCEPPPSAPPSPAVKEPVPTAVEKPAEKPADKQTNPVEKPPAARTTDDFNLPLVIVMEAPETPPEIRGPSPPIKAEPAPP
jgi:hypothetical protein